MRLALVFVILFAIVSVSGIILFFIGESDYIIEEVDCFDKYGRKIQELTCDKKIYSEIYDMGGLLMVFSIIIFGVVATAIVLDI